MNIQIYGAKKCFDTKKAERYFKERKIPFQSIDIHRFGMSKSVFESAKRCIDVEDMIDRKAKAYKIYIWITSTRKNGKAASLKILPFSGHPSSATERNSHWVTARTYGKTGNNKGGFCI